MAVKDDYVMRMIKDMARVLARLILGKDDINYVLPEDEEFTVIDNLYKKLITMADAGQINEAENILLNELEDKSSEYFEMAASFYLHLNEYSDGFLDAHQKRSMKEWEIWVKNLESIWEEQKNGSRSKHHAEGGSPDRGASIYSAF